MAHQSSRSEQPAATEDPPARARNPASIMISFSLCLGLWGLLSQGQGWAFGIPLAAMAAFVASGLQLDWRPLQLRPLAALLGFFLRELFSGGWDVARRALHLRMPIDPAWHRFPLTSRNRHVHLLLSAMVGLLPGTLASHYEEQVLHVHVLDQQQDWQDVIARLETLLSRLLGDI